MSFNFRTDSVVSKDGEGKTELPYGATIPSGTTINVQGNVNVSGVSTVGILSAPGIVVSGIVTATSFVGDGSGLTAIQSISAAKSIALKYIISDPPLRS